MPATTDLSLALVEGYVGEVVIERTAVSYIVDCLFNDIVLPESFVIYYYGDCDSEIRTLFGYDGGC